MKPILYIHNTHTKDTKDDMLQFTLKLQHISNDNDRNALILKYAKNDIADDCTVLIVVMLASHAKVLSRALGQTSEILTGDSQALERFEVKRRMREKESNVLIVTRAALQLFMNTNDSGYIDTIYSVVPHNDQYISNLILSLLPTSKQTKLRVFVDFDISYLKQCCYHFVNFIKSKVEFPSDLNQVKLRTKLSLK